MTEDCKTVALAGVAQADKTSSSRDRCVPNDEQSWSTT